MQRNFRVLREKIDKSRNIVLTTHVTPDGDAIGSALAFYGYLKAKGKNVRIINHSPTPDNLTFLDSKGVIKIFLKDKKKHSDIIRRADLVFILDTNEYSRIKTMENAVRNSKAEKICIDHHLGTDLNSFDLVLSDISIPATSQILYDYIKWEGVKYLTPQVATALYAGIMTDTGSFRYPRTSEKTFLICADLVKRGSDPVAVYDKIYCNIGKGKVRMLARFIDSFSFHFDDTVVIGIVTQEDFREFHSGIQDVEGFSTLLMNIKNIKSGFVIVELDKTIKLSFRSKGNIKINEFAALFGGGGHKNAAGATVPRANPKDIKDEIIRRYKDFFQV